MMNRRSLFKSLAVGAGGIGAGLIRPTRAEAALPKATVTRVKCWEHPSMNRSFNQSAMLVSVEAAGLIATGFQCCAFPRLDCQGILRAKQALRC